MSTGWTIGYAVAVERITARAATVREHLSAEADRAAQETAQGNDPDGGPRDGGEG
jgi:hypothetical protein